jgi:uncharacterized membrane protein YphA (DoxX/SURF4 family)
MQLMVGVFMVVMGIGIAGIWTIDILKSPEVDRSRGLVRARDRAGSVMLPHWVAEYATALSCLVGGLALALGWTSRPWSWVVAIALGALAYTSLNSLSWVLADRSRMSYGVPMVIGLAGALTAILLLLSGSLL